MPGCILSHFLPSRSTNEKRWRDLGDTIISSGHVSTRSINRLLILLPPRFHAVRCHFKIHSSWGGSGGTVTSSPPNHYLHRRSSDTLEQEANATCNWRIVLGVVHLKRLRSFQIVWRMTYVMGTKLHQFSSYGKWQWNPPKDSHDRVSFGIKWHVCSAWWFLPFLLLFCFFFFFLPNRNSGDLLVLTYERRKIVLRSPYAAIYQKDSSVTATCIVYAITRHD